MLDHTPRRGFLRLLAAAPLAALALRSDGARAKKRKPKKAPIPHYVLDGYDIYPWKTSTIIVRDYMPERWGAVLREQVAGIQAQMPAYGPKVVYEDAGHHQCGEYDTSIFESGVVQVCDKTFQQESANALTFVENGYVTEGSVYIPDGWFDGQEGLFGAHRVVCHELMHAMLHVTDRDESVEGPKDSCVLGFTKFAGGWDKAAFEMVYGGGATSPAKTGKKRRKH